MYFLGRNTCWPFQNTSTNYMQLMVDYLNLITRISSTNVSSMVNLVRKMFDYHRELNYDQLNFAYIYNVAAETLGEMIIR